MALSISTDVTVSYWAIIFDGSLSEGLKGFLSIDRHGVNLIFIIIDFFLNRIPIRLLHFLYASFFMLAYKIFNVIYTISSNNPVYKKADWNNKPGVAADVFVTQIVALIFFHVMWFFVDFLIKKCCKKDDSVDYTPVKEEENWKT